MKKKLLIISSDHTGHGHKSITESICEKIENPNQIEVHVVDGFSLGDKVLMGIGKSYGPITRKAENLWKVLWNVSAKKPELVDSFIEAQIRENFLLLLEEVKPDLILSVHPNFNGSIINILEKHHKKIPFITLIADLVNIYPLWADRRADFIISPTIDARNKCIGYGIPAEKIITLGFPVRSRFFRKDAVHNKNRDGQPLRCLIMSGGEGSGNMKEIAENLLDHFHCHVSIVAGRNAKMKMKLEQALKGTYGDRVEIFGFVKNIQELMLSSDIAFTRGSPNVMFEAIASNTPLIITGALPGQEKDNPAFAEKLNLGVICKNPSDIKETITKLLENNGEKLKSIQVSQKRYINSHAAEDILQFILATGEPQHKARMKLS